MRSNIASNLFTIEFSDSNEEESEDEEEYESDEEEEEIIRLDTKKINSFKPSPIVKKKQSPNQSIGNMMEISDSYSSDSTLTESDSPKIKIIKQKIQLPESSHENDIFTLNDEKLEQQPNESDSTLQPTKQQKPKTDNNHLQKRHNNWSIYLIKRKKFTNIKGIRIFFTFEENSKQLFAAKCKSNSPSKIYIVQGTDVHLSSKPDALIIVENNEKNFLLEETEGERVMAARFAAPKWPSDTARKVEVEFLKPKQGTPNILKSKNPPLNPDGKPTYDFEGHFAFESVKNAVLYEKEDGPKMMLIRKVGDDAIEVEARFEHEPVWIFAVGIASFLADA